MAKMRKVALLLLAALVLLGLAGCGDKPTEAGLSNGDAGDFFGEYQMTERDNHWYIKGTAHVENKLTLAELKNSWRESVPVDLNLLFKPLEQDFGLYYVTPEGEEELGVASDSGKSGAGGTLSWQLEIVPGDSRLELRPLTDKEEPVEIAFNFSLTYIGGNNLEVLMPGLLANGLGEEFAFTLPTLEELERAEKNEADKMASVRVNQVPVAIEAGESRVLLEFDPESPADIKLNAKLLDFSGDVQLYYVNKGAAELLWDSRGPEDEKLVELGLTLLIELEPGEGRLEWRSQSGTEFTQTLLWEEVARAGITKIGI